MLSKPGPTPFQAEYDRRVADGRIKPDDGYGDALRTFDRLSAALGDMFEFGGQGNADRCRGVYLWGGVGRGKSMLMDILYETASGAAKWRVHFHASCRKCMPTCRKPGCEGQPWGPDRAGG